MSGFISKKFISWVYLLRKTFKKFVYSSFLSYLFQIVTYSIFTVYGAFSLPMFLLLKQLGNSSVSVYQNFIHVKFSPMQIFDPHDSAYRIHVSIFLGFSWVLARKSGQSIHDLSGQKIQSYKIVHIILLNVNCFQ
jgi:hypothetical protein